MAAGRKYRLLRILVQSVDPKLHGKGHFTSSNRRQCVAVVGLPIQSIADSLCGEIACAENEMTREMLLQPPQSSAADENAVTLSDIVILGFTALILELPMLIYGPMVNGHGTYEHLNYCRHFAEQFW